MAITEATFRVKFIPTAGSDNPVVVNCSAVNVAQGTGYIDFGFIEPPAIVRLTDALRAGEKPPEEVEAKHLLRIAMSPQAMQQLMRQMNEVLTKINFLRSEESK